MQYLKEEIKNRILLAALDEFKEKGYSSASIRNIASNADIALGTVYKYFKNKEDLFNSIVDPVYNDLFAAINKIIMTEVNPDDKLIEIKNKILDIFKGHSKELLILFGKSKGSKYENFKDELVDVLHKILQKETFSRFEDKSVVKEPFIFYVLSANFIDGIYTILKTQENGEKIGMLIDQLIFLSFHSIERRFKEMSHIY
ncbi:TetR/AcrR family transcriptional regulator [Lysinibacillus sp. NPDC097279]|uniref:TetR/AcrR family transcriptional regulator n=1 Tax=Lysinibacillus sp. NPDC097279 TaxID=3364143 RepID=UPI00382AC1BF